MVTAFSPFTFGSKSSTLNPLPIELLEFTATCSKEGVKINWATASEYNNAYFLIERSTDAVNWMEVKRVYSLGNNTSITNYSLLDTFFSEDMVYYRLSQMDKNLIEKKYEIVGLLCKKEKREFDFFPNPAHDKIQFVFSSGNSFRQGILTIYDNLGRQCLKKQIDLDLDTSVFLLPINLVPGVYIVTYNTETSPQQIKKLVVQ